MRPNRDELPEFLREALDQEPELDREVALRLPEVLGSRAIAPKGLERLMSAVAEPPLAYAPFYDRLTDLWGVGEPEMLRVLTLSRDPHAWRREALPGSRTIDVEAGSRTGSATLCLAQFSPGFRFPKHRHPGPEAVLVLRGGYTDSSGWVVGPGDVQEMKGGSEHALSVHEGEPCVIAVRQEGMEFTGPVMRLLSRAYRGLRR